MAYKTLLAHMSNEDVSPAVLQVASLLAERHSAHLVGLHIQPPLDLYVSELPTPIDLSREYLDRLRLKESRLRELFEAGTQTQNYVAEWRTVDALTDTVLNALVEQGNTADLIVISQTEGDNSDVRFRHLPEHVLMACGRSLLVVPVGSDVDTVAERVLVAWDGRRESTRALFGSLPLLRRASEVRLHRINQPHQDRHHLSGITEELANTLARHGVSLELVHSDARSGEIAEELMGFAKDMDADLMVMGCYGHSPLREFVLGGTTRTVLAKTPIPVLMSN
ncbi:universal stress protein [Granulosicoccus sp. 3-233]|uniref:universal stress protein n=1 Tax=Granulosicoccus sp. 3-233 TaxID=3417969 RepID=UPI003D32CD5B